jgi:hypothetical protein
MRIGHTLTLLAFCALCGCAHHTTTVAKTPFPPPPPPPPVHEATAAAAIALPHETAEVLAAVATAGHPTAAGQISGTVTDATGATISGSTVRAIRAGTSQSVTTNAAGQYTLSGLPPGTYSLTFSRAGFQTTVLQGIAVSAGQAALTDVRLTTGATNTEVMVTAAVPSPLNTRAKVDAWFKHLPKGSVQYKVPGEMVLMQPYTATATIYPPGVVPPTATPAAGAAAGANRAPAAQVATPSPRDCNLDAR